MSNTLVIMEMRAGAPPSGTENQERGVWHQDTWGMQEKHTLNGAASKPVAGKSSQSPGM